jgi:acyl-coenzyme A thioesterase PaaI-like protein
VGDVADAGSHSIWLLFAAVVVNLVATVLKLGDRSQVGALLLATALVADLQLLTGALIWAFADTAAGLASGTVVTVVSLASGALVANVVSVTLLVADSLISGR